MIHDSDGVFEIWAGLQSIRSELQGKAKNCARILYTQGAVHGLGEQFFIRADALLDS
jgi:hypothetical protein